MKYSRLHRNRGQRGGAFVEFAFGMLILTPLLLGTFSFGLAMRDYNALQTAVRNGARFASLQDYDSATGTPSSGFQRRVQNVVVYGNPDGGNAPLVQDLTTANVQLTVTMRSGVPYEMTVAITNFTLVDFFRPIVLTGKPACTFPYMGRYAPPV